MSNTHTWTIESCDVCPTMTVEGTPLEQVVCRVHWRCTSTDGTHTTSAYGVVSLPDPDPASFIAWEALDLPTILGWVYANGVDETATTTANDARIHSLANPMTVPMLPPGI